MDSTLRDIALQGASLPGGVAASGPPSKIFDEAVIAAKSQVTSEAPSDAPAMPSATDKRPEGDTRSAQEIIDANPTLKNLGNQSGVKDKLREQVGDFESDPDAAYRASEVLDHIKGAKTSHGEERSGDVTDNGKIEGFTKDGDARHGTEAGLLQDFGKYGYSALKSDQTLDLTRDDQVTEDGTNIDNATAAGNRLSYVLTAALGFNSDINTQEKYLNDLKDAIKSGDAQAVADLVKVPPKSMNIDSSAAARMALHDAINYGGQNVDEVVRVLVDQGGIDLAKLDGDGRSAYQVLDARAKAEHDPELRRAADAVRDKMNGELGRAVFDGDQERAVALLKAGADPKCTINADPEKSKGFTLLMFAAANKEPDTVKAMLDAIPEGERKDFINQKDDTGSTALHAAAFGGDDATYKMLVEAGGDEAV